MGRKVAITSPSLCKLRICITGAGGFIGGHLARYFQQSHSDEYDIVTIPHQSARNFQFQKGDIVIHAGGLAHGAAQHPDEYALANFELTIKLAGNARKAEVRLFIFLSSVLVLGSEAGIYNNFSLPNPETPYARSKAMAEMALENLFHSEVHIGCLILRLPMVYGNGCKGNAGVLSRLAEKQIPLPLGGVKSRRSFLHIDKLSTIIDAEIGVSRNGCTVLYAKDDKDMTVAELYNVMCGRKRTFWFPASLLNLLGFMPFLSQLRKLNQEYRFVNFYSR